MGVLNRCLWGRCRRQRLAFEAVPKDGLDALVAEGVQRQGAATGGFQPGCAVVLAQPQDAQAGAVALDRVGAGGEDLLDHLGGGGSGLLSPAHQAVRTPLHILPVVVGHMGQHCGVPAPGKRA